MLWLLHGNLGSPADWKPVMDFLRAGGVEARALNLWRYLECCPKSLKDMGRVLCSEIASQDRHPLICGYSLGGRLAMQAVLAHPPLWKGLGHLWEHHTDVLSDPFVYDLTRLVITRRRYSYPVAVHNIRNHRLYLSLHLWSDRWNELLLVKQP